MGELLFGDLTEKIIGAAYSKETKFQLGLHINFGDRVEFKRFIYSFDKK